MTPDISVDLATASFQSGTNPLRGQRFESPEAAHAAAREFESFFLMQALQQMFSGIEQDPLFGGGPGEEIFKSMLLQEYSKLVGTSKTLGIQEITLPMLLELMGYKPEVRTVGLGKRADPLQFKAEPEEGRQRTSSSGETFRPREPRRKSAY